MCNNCAKLEVVWENKQIFDDQKVGYVVCFIFLINARDFLHVINKNII